MHGAHPLDPKAGDELRQRIERPIGDAGGPAEIATRLLRALGCKLSPESRTPALANGSLYCPIAVNSSVEGITPAPLFGVALMMTTTRMSLSPSVS